ncbi:rRNA methyltransferase [Actinoplanes sp. SE50]|uniref:TrmH family RNA methyltransferase n=1 Tax=unclassified Actinoplanes TaxID=2626549 RepID=UPI00023EC574|nr:MULTISPECIES: TrmH family RNA methyltransferase [unclassified Actinoplanes]AEV81927.1 RNA methyltransferase, TrmH family [Actinoplanes sp. SE50/110]ATO80327.1 rRNA methyltransferase [Actinoplanes sp. SE50]SLL97733.1 rRNA methyltransferase [Actinoplanes sp. SE50/110]
MSRTMRVSTRNATFQQWQALLTNRTKRHRAGEFVVQGVRPITLAVDHGWPVHAVLLDDARRLSRWSRDVLDRTDAARFAVSGELMHELGGKDEESPELLAVVGMPADDLTRIGAGPDMLALVFDRPTTPANIGALVRSADAFGATGLIIAGHAADPYDPKAVRASTGSLFALPVVQVASHREVVDHVIGLRRGGLPVEILGSDEGGDVDLDEHDLTGPKVIAIGNETRGLSGAWREACDHILRIPMTGAASSLNAAAAGSVVLYEAARQRRH